MLETNHKRSTGERLSVVESKVSKLDVIEDKVTDIQVCVAKIEHKLEDLIDHVEKHTAIDSKRLDSLEDFVTEQKAKADHVIKLWSRFATVIAIIGTLVAIYVNLKGK